jgi:hypothetical protein
MKRLKVILSITILMTTFVLSAIAQNRPERTSSVRAYYGDRPGKPNFKKKKKQKIKDYTHTRPAKGTRADAWSSRKKYQRS